MRCGIERVESQVESIKPEGPAPIMSTHVEEVGRVEGVVHGGEVVVVDGEEAIADIGRMVLKERESGRKRDDEWEKVSFGRLLSALPSCYYAVM